MTNDPESRLAPFVIYMTLIIVRLDITALSMFCHELLVFLLCPWGMRNRVGDGNRHVALTTPERAPDSPPARSRAMRCRKTA